MNGILYDTSKTGLRAVLRDWQINVMQIIWSKPEGAISRVAHQEVNRALGGESISRASVINFLEDMRVMGVFSGREESGKGGYHWVYGPGLDEGGFRLFIVRRVMAALMESFPQETKEVLKSLVT